MNGLLLTGVNGRFIVGSILTLTVVSLLSLQSIIKSSLPQYFVLVAIAFVIFFIILNIDFEIFSVFSKHLYFFAVFLLVLTLIIGQVTRGAVRWIPLGSFSFQPSEVMRPFLFLFLAKVATGNVSDEKKLLRTFLYFLIPFLLILAQPSFGVALLTAVGFVGIVLSSDIDKRKLLIWFLFGVFLVPLLFLVLKPYQKERVASFFNPWKDPSGAGYNSIQSMISVGSGGITGRGLGKGAGTQLRFLPERQNDFIFASISEEMGFIGVSIVLMAYFVFFWTLANIISGIRNPVAKNFVGGVFLTMLAQTFINIGMNTGILPITGVPLPYVSEGGSSLIAGLISAAICIKTEKSIVLGRN